MNAHEQAQEMLRAAPPLTVTAMSIFGFSISDWAFLLTAIYTLLMIVLLVRRQIVAHRASDDTCIADCPARKK